MHGRIWRPLGRRHRRAWGRIYALVTGGDTRDDGGGNIGDRGKARGDMQHARVVCGETYAPTAVAVSCVRLMAAMACPLSTILRCGNRIV